MNIEIYSEKFFEDIKHITEDERRILLRSDVREFNKKLAKAAQN